MTLDVLVDIDGSIFGFTAGEPQTTQPTFTMSGLRRSAGNALTELRVSSPLPDVLA